MEFRKEKMVRLHAVQTNLKVLGLQYQVRVSVQFQPQFCIKNTIKCLLASIKSKSVSYK